LGVSSATGNSSGPRLLLVDERVHRNGTVSRAAGQGLLARHDARRYPGLRVPAWRHETTRSPEQDSVRGVRAVEVGTGIRANAPKGRRTQLPTIFSTPASSVDPVDGATTPSYLRSR
jgi:hypothetical protein